MAHRKAGGSAKNLRDSNPKYLGVKKGCGSPVSCGQIIVRQRGTKCIPGSGVGVGKDHTLFAKKDGFVSFSKKRVTKFTGHSSVKSIVNVK